MKCTNKLAFYTVMNLTLAPTYFVFIDSAGRLNNYTSSDLQFLKMVWMLIRNNMLVQKFSKYDSVFTALMTIIIFSYSEEHKLLLQITSIVAHLNLLYILVHS